MIVNNQKSKETKKSTPIETKGVETLRKNCYKRKDGRWQYSKQKEGLKYYCIANTYRQLLENIPKIKPVLVKNIKHQKTKTRHNSFLQYYQSYIDTYINTKNITIETKNDWQRQLRNDLKPSFHNIKLENITSEQIQIFLNNITHEVKRNKLYQRITKVLKKAYATGRIKRDITLGIEKPKQENKKKRYPLTFKEQILLLKEAKKNKEIFPFIMFSIIIGSRRDETIKFELDKDIDEKKQTIHIKGTKTDNADRFVKTSKEFIQFLKNNMIKNKFNFTTSYATHTLNKIFKKHNIDACLHSLRHTCSANLYFLGANDKYRQKQLGHASIVTTNDIYTNIKENITKRKLRILYGDLYPCFD